MLYLLERTNSDWWAVRVPSNKQVGYVPANYVRELPLESAESSEEPKKSDTPDAGAGATTTPKSSALQKPAATRVDSGSDSVAKAARPSLPNTPRPVPVAAGALPLHLFDLTGLSQLYNHKLCNLKVM